LGIDRGELKDIDGFFAVLLWNDYQRNGNQKALDTLLAYNIQDVLTLEDLMVISYNLKIKDTPFNGNLLPEPVLPKTPFDVDMRTVEKIRDKYRHVFQNSSYCQVIKGVICLSVASSVFFAANFFIAPCSLSQVPAH
jgi:hypothetical protein